MEVVCSSREDISPRQLSNHALPADIESVFIELNFRKSKWLIGGIYYPPNQKDEYIFKCIGRGPEAYNDNYDKVLLAGDFNAEEMNLSLINLWTYVM